MAEDSNIEWCDHTFNPWSGCTKVSAGCANCYAEVNYSVKMRGVKWGPRGNRIVAAEASWKKPVTWNKVAGVLAELPGVNRPRVFCASLADVFEDWKGPMIRPDGYELSICHDCGGWMFYTQQDCTPGCKCDRAPRPLTMQDVRNRLFALIDATPNLDWLVLTKRPENIAKMMPVKMEYDHAASCELAAAVETPIVRPNVWLGTSVENQQAADERIPHLLRVPAAIRFLSCEPLLGPVDITRWIGPRRECEFYNDAPTPQRRREGVVNCERYENASGACKAGFCPLGLIGGIHWVIVGGESGPGARPCNVAWIRSIVEQCRAAGVPCFVKQMGGNIVTRNDMVEDVFNDENGWPEPEVEHDIHGFREEYQGADCRIRLRDKKGGDPAEWPADLRVREFPSRSAT